MLWVFCCFGLGDGDGFEILDRVVMAFLVLVFRGQGCDTNVFGLNIPIGLYKCVYTTGFR